MGPALRLVAHSSDSNSVSDTADSVEANSNLVASVPVVLQDVSAMCAHKGTIIYAHAQIKWKMNGVSDIKKREKEWCKWCTDNCAIGERRMRQIVNMKTKI